MPLEFARYSWVCGGRITSRSIGVDLRMAHAERLRSPSVRANWTVWSWPKSLGEASSDRVGCRYVCEIEYVIRRLSHKALPKKRVVHIFRRSLF